MRCEEYLQTLVSAGFDDLEWIAEHGLTDADLTAIGVTKVGHRRKLSSLHRIQEFITGSDKSKVGRDGVASESKTAEHKVGDEEDAADEDGDDDNDDDDAEDDDDGDGEDEEDEGEGGGGEEEEEEDDEEEEEEDAE